MATSILNVADCATQEGNTGSPDCFFNPQLIEGGFLVPKNFEIPASALISQVTLQAFLADAILAPKGQRIYPLPKGEAFTNNSADVTIQQLSGGASIPVKDGDYDFTQQYLIGGLCTSNQMRKFKGTGMKYLAIDADGTIMGTQNVTKDGIKGVPLIYFYPYPFAFNTGAEVSSYRYRIAMRPEYFNEKIAWVKTDFDVLGMTGLINVSLKNTVRAANVLTVEAKTCAGGNLVDEYGGALAASGAWVVTGTAGASVTITSVTATATGFALTLTATGAYNTTAGGMLISLESADVLDTLGLHGYESNTTPSLAV